VEFVAITNDVLADVGKHYLTVWMRGDANGATTRIADTAEITRIGWFAPDRLPSPLHLYFQVIVGPVHLQTCHSRFHLNLNQTQLSGLSARND
jgi:hypothetical protein